MPITHVNPDGMHRNPAFSWAVRVPAGHDTIYIGGQNGVGPDGTVVGPGLREQTSKALENLRTCVEAAGASITDVVKSWSSPRTCATCARLPAAARRRARTGCAPAPRL